MPLDLLPRDGAALSGLGLPELVNKLRTAPPDMLTDFLVEAIPQRRLSSQTTLDQLFSTCGSQPLS